MASAGADRYLALIRGDRRGPLAALARFGLRLLSVPYGAAVRLRNWAFSRGWKRSFAAPVPVISIGNLTVGGTGKTPCVEYVARLFRQRDVQVAILSRGYGAKDGPNDEALVLEQNLPDVPHLQGRDRVELARIAVEELESELLILDDGFQHRRLKRDLDIVLVDATNPWGHGALLPRGLLREPVSSLRRAHFVLMTRCDLVDEAARQAIEARIRRVAAGVPIAQSRHRPAVWINSAGGTLPLGDTGPRPVAAFCGLGNPDGFKKTLASLGHEPIAWRVYPDHHAYTGADIDELRAWARALPAEALLATTQKDLVKIGLERLGERELWALRIELELTSAEDRLRDTLASALKAPTD
ncbi:MAG: tetraacyldisaccharide 4'-kinase [Gemmataceae bacterium]